MSLKIKDTLFHGTISEILHVDTSLGQGRKDFGKGFYMSVEKSQAIGMMHKKYREAVRRSRNKDPRMFTERLYEVKIDTEYAASLNVKEFSEANSEWLDFILLCREQGGVPHEYDLVIGPTADDDTMLCLKTYWDGFYGKVGSDEAKQILLRNLEPENLGIQYFVADQRIADRLILSITETDWRR